MYIYKCNSALSYINYTKPAFQGRMKVYEILLGRDCPFQNVRKLSENLHL